MGEQTKASARAATPREGVEGGAPPVIDAAFARWLADRAGQELMRVRAELGHADGKALKAAGDKAAHELLRTELARWRPADAVLSEEDEHSRMAWRDGEPDVVRPDRLSASRVWIVDPLDGTREFSEEGRTDWAVHVALWTADSCKSDASCLSAGAVAMPARHRTIATDNPPAYPPMPLESATGGAIRIAASRTRPPAFVTALAEDLGAELVPMGSAGVKIAAVISGEADAYVHAGGQYEWDSAAPVAVALATGLHASRIDGSPLRYNEADPKLPDLVVCRKDLAPRLLAAISKHLPPQ
ncbi:3'(2'),5'-bisphosphate nucleotidase CysQ [Actinoplanes oblitus]|uniref:3'(2'),5-bisphosphonucleoside 3'(2')-phosphohydrolase n=1 Tax=Actinoplanes oblitus TaxID=3040509 RepID=A0ABY8WGH2_9ACTN|nr:3'(2'),5'-bisphosphate nucleotidase CysQ [Actinoplanes oblitus]WIM95975.1 3'(2'),5'-bisphosphate nucleotidase CysQ [Actinoplanes oblitus]